MANINLLPWREEFRQEKKKEFQLQMVFCCLAAGIASFIWISVVDNAIQVQKARNALLESEIAVLEKRVAEINELKKKREDLIARMKIIQDLQGTRPTIVRYFDGVVRAIPEGVFFNLLTKKADLLSVQGVTESSNRVATLMRQLDESEWFSAPNLKSIKANPTFGEQAAEFTLEFKAVLPADESKADGEGN